MVAQSNSQQMVTCTFMQLSSWRTFYWLKHSMAIEWISSAQMGVFECGSGCFEFDSIQFGLISWKIDKIISCTAWPYTMHLPPPKKFQFSSKLFHKVCAVWIIRVRQHLTQVIWLCAVRGTPTKKPCPKTATCLRVLFLQKRLTLLSFTSLVGLLVSNIRTRVLSLSLSYHTHHSEVLALFNSIIALEFRIFTQFSESFHRVYAIHWILLGNILPPWDMPVARLLGVSRARTLPHTQYRQLLQDKHGVFVCLWYNATWLCLRFDDTPN